ncbi:hypothetical protein RHGRI_008474 [Rhododendron griersonianum]|uniref:ADP-ribosylation factor-related protein 1 n=1 Tax=Rhododendron griersonianum TaxID=479676 RepID=A0AAV6L1D1_9ERIC|nr:hypothetical protein RHGRI_008474 [Rhododendron griersonianum]
MSFNIGIMSISKTEFRVLILGIDKAGKTTLLEKLKAHYSNLEGLPPDRIVPTVGLNIGRVEVLNSKLVFWDLGGQLGLRSIWEKYYEEAHAVVFVVDAACPLRFEDSKSALEKVLRHEDLRGAPLLILANKQVSKLLLYYLLQCSSSSFDTDTKNRSCPFFFWRIHFGSLDSEGYGGDLADAVSVEELARYLDLKKLDERAYTFEGVSAYDGTGIKESVDWLVEVMERSKRTEMLRVRAGVAA